MWLTKNLVNDILIMIGGFKVAKKKNNETNKEIVNGATIMICIFMLVIGFALGWLSSLFLV